MKAQTKEGTTVTTEPALRQVLLSIQTKPIWLQGIWWWELQSSAVFCSDVMSFPEDFEGTKGIIHPDDLEKVKAAVSLLPEMTIARLNFRMITTYGQVIELDGSQVQLSEAAPWMTEQYATAEGWETHLRNSVHKAETSFLRLRQTLSEKSEKYADTASWYINKISGETWYSDNMYRLHGVPPQSLNANPHTFNIFIHPDDKAAVLEAFEQAYAGELPLHLEYRIIRPGGEEVWVRQITYWGFNDQGHPFFAGLVRSLQEEQQLQAQLDAIDLQNRLLQQVLQQAEKQGRFGYWTMNLVTRKTTFSPAYLRIHGIKQGIMATQAFFLSLVHPDDKAMVAERMDQLNKTHELPETEYRIIRPDGKVRHLQLSGKLVVFSNNELVMVGVANDVSAGKRQEQTIQELSDTLLLQNNMLQQAEQVGELASLVLFPDGSMRWSDGFYRLLGYRPRSVEPLLQAFRNSIHPSDLEPFNDNFALLRKLQEVAPFSFRIITRAGVRQVVLTTSPVSEQGRTAFIGILQDLTHRQEGTRQTDLQDRYQRLLEDVSRDMLIYTNAENTILGWNAAATAKTGIKKEEALGANLLELLPHLRSETYLSQLNSVLAGKEVQVHKCRYQYLPGPQSFRLNPHLDEAGAVQGVLHLVQDIERELDLQQQLSERLRFIESLVDASVDRIVVLDKHMNYLYWNPRAEAYYALRKEQVLGRNILEVFPSLRNDPSYQEFRRALKGETVHLPASFAPGQQHYFETYLVPVRDDEGSVNAVLWMVHDLTREGQLQLQRQHAMQLLSEEHRRLKEAQGIGHIGSFEWNMGAEAVSWSDELYRMMGWEPQSRTILAAQTNDWVHPDDKDGVLALKHQSFEEPGYYHIDHRIVRPSDGQVIYVAHRFESIADENGQVVRVHGTVQDITHRVEVRQRVEASENLLRSAELVARTGSYEVELATMAFRFSEGMYRLFGEEPFSFAPSLEFIDSRSHPDDILPVKIILEEAALNRTPYYYMRRIYRKDGSMRTLEAHGQVKCDQHGNAIRFIGLVQDVTERQAAAQQMDQQAQFLKSITDAVPDLIGVVELPSRDMQFLNNNLLVANGFNPQDMNQVLWSELESWVHPDDRANLARYNRQLETLSKDTVAMIDFRFLAGENTLWVRSRTKVFRYDEAGRATHLLLIMQDVSSTYMAQETLTRLNATLQQKNHELEIKNEEITSYAFVASHDLKEPIRKLHTFMDILQQREGGRLSDGGHDVLERMFKSLTRLEFLITDILSLSQLHAIQDSFALVNLNTVLERVKADLDEQVAESGAEIRAADLGSFKAIETQLFYLLKNLLSNAIKFQAKGNKPVVTIQTRYLSGADINRRNLSGNFLKLEISDNGIGFDPKYKKQVFRIFQRLHNKEAFAGTGMGLAICRKVMENHNGFIEVDSKPGHGTTFCCYFPV